MCIDPTTGMHHHFIKLVQVHFILDFIHIFLRKTHAGGLWIRCSVVFAGGIGILYKYHLIVSKLFLLESNLLRVGAIGSDERNTRCGGWAIFTKWWGLAVIVSSMC